MSKKKKRNFISDIWRKMDEAVSSYAAKKISKKDFDEIIEFVIDEANKSGMPDLIAENLINPYLQTETVSVKFARNEIDDDGCGVFFSDDLTNVSIDPLGVHKFYSLISSSALRLDSKSCDDFEEIRKLSFYRELCKLPALYFIFISVLSKFSMQQQVFTAEKRGGKKIILSSISVLSYFPLLWALKQFEAFYKRIQNRDMRSDFGIIWHEGEWVEKNKN